MTIKFDHKTEEIYVIKQCLRALKKHSDSIPLAQNVIYEYGVPSIVYRLLKTEIFKRETQIRIEELSQKTRLEPSVIRKLLKSHTFTEIEEGCKDGKVCIEDKEVYYKDGR